MSAENQIDDRAVNTLRQALEQWDLAELHQLVKYYAVKPYPSMQVLLDVMSSRVLVVNAERTWMSLADNDATIRRAPTVYDPNKASDVIHRFESVVQAQDATGLSKRHYSIEADDRQQLLRVLAGIKRKGLGDLESDEQQALVNLLYYTNGFAQVARLSEQTWLQLIDTRQPHTNARFTLRGLAP